MALSESVVLSIQQALAQLEKLDERLARLFSKTHQIKVTTVDAQRRLAQLESAKKALTEPVTVQLNVTEAKTKVALLDKSIRNLSKPVTIEVNTGKAVQSVAKLQTALKGLTSPAGARKATSDLLAFSQAATALGRASASAPSIRKLSSSLQSLATGFGQLKPVASSAANRIEKISAATSTVTKSQVDNLSKLATGIRKLTTNLAEFDVPRSKLNRFENLSTSISTVTKSQVDNLSKLATGIRRLGRSLEELNVPRSKLNGVTNLVNAVSAVKRQQAETVSELASSIRNLNTALRQFDVPKTKLNAIANVATGLAGVTPQLNRFANSASKASEAITNLSAAAPELTKTFAETVDSDQFDTATRRVRSLADATSQATANLTQLNDKTVEYNRNAGEIVRHERAMRNIGSSMIEVGRRLSLYVTLPIGAAAAAAGFLAFRFNETITKIRLLTSAIEFSSAKFTETVEGIKAIAAETGQTPQAVAEGFYFLASAVDAADARLSTLRVAAQAATVGLGDVSELTDAISSVINAYGREAITAAQAGDILVESVRAAKVEASEFAPQLGRLLPLASQLGLGFEQVGAALALLTRTGNSAAVASTQLRAFLLALVKPPEQAAKALAQVGLSFSDIRDALREGGLQAAIQLLTSRIGTNEEALTRLFRRQEGYLALLQVSANGFRDFNEILAQTSTGLDNATGSLTVFEQFTRESKTLQLRQQFSQLMAQLIDIGTSVLPLATAALEGLATAFRTLGDMLGRDVIGALLKATIAAAALLGPFLALGGTILKLTALFGNLSRIATTALQNLLSRASPASQAMQRLGTSTDGAATASTRLQNAITFAAKALGVATTAAASFTASALTGYIGGAAAASTDAQSKLMSLATTIAGIGTSSVIAGTAIGRMAGPIAGIATGALSAAVGLASFAASAREATSRRIEEGFKALATSLKDLPAQEVLARFDFVADEDQTAASAKSAIANAKEVFQQALDDTDLLSEIEADDLISVLGSGQVKTDFDEFVKQAAVNSTDAVKRYAGELGEQFAVRFASSIDKALTGVEILADTEMLFDGVIDRAESISLVSRAVSELPDDVRRFAQALAEANLIVASLDQTTGLVSFSVSDTAAALRVLGAVASEEVTPLLQGIIGQLDEQGVLAAIAQGNVTRLSNSYGDLVENADGDLELIPAETLDTTQKMAEAIDDIVAGLTQLGGLSVDKTLTSQLNDAIVAAQQLEVNTGDVAAKLLDFTDVSVEDLRDDIDSLVETFINGVAESVSTAASRGDVASIDAIEFITVAKFDQLAASIAESLGVSFDQAKWILADRGITLEGLRTLIRNPDIQLLAEDVQLQGQLVDTVKAALEGAGIDIPLSIGFDQKDYSTQLDELRSNVALLISSKPSLALPIILKLAESGDAGQAAIADLIASDAINRDVIINAIATVATSGELDEETVRTLLAGDITRDALLEYSARVVADETGGSPESIRSDFERRLRAGETIDIKVRVTEIKPEHRSLSPDTLERYLANEATANTISTRTRVAQTITLKVDADTKPAEEATDEVVESINDKIAKFQMRADTSQVSQQVASVVSYIESLSPTIRVRVRTINTSTYNPAQLLPGLGLERGGVVAGRVRSFADGGTAGEPIVGVPRQPMIAATRPPTAGILWAEPTTEGEAYIPFTRRHRKRATGILELVADQFGYAVVPKIRAAAGFTVKQPTVTPAATASLDVRTMVADFAKAVGAAVEKALKANTPTASPVVGELVINSNIPDPRGAAMHIAAELSRFT